MFQSGEGFLGRRFIRRHLGNSMKNISNKVTKSYHRGWFPEENKTTLLKIIQEHNIKTVIEIGSFLGASTAFFATHCDHVYAIDPFKKWQEGIKRWYIDEVDEYFYDQFDFNMKELGVRNRITAIPSTSIDAAGLFPNLKADLVYIDAIHDYDNVKRDIKLWKDRASIIVCGDDYDENWTELKKAVDEVANVQVDGRVWFIKK